ncbi:MAG: site-specific integrase [Lachnospiraceae bacterium]|nr:site-specific integrase [Lachnospiraceae bacterium]
MAYGKIRRDSKHRVLHRGESVRNDGKYIFKYHLFGKAKYLTSWRLEPTDKQPQGTKPTLSLREMEKQLGKDLESLMDPLGRNLTVKECVERYVATKTGVKPSTKAGYKTVMNRMEKMDFYYKKVREVKTSDAKLFLIKLQQEEGLKYSTVTTMRGVLRPAFQMAMDDDIISKNPFQFELAGVLYNDTVIKQGITQDEMRKFLKFVHDDVVYCKYYEVVYILFHTGLRISEFCGLTISDLDMENRVINIDHQLVRVGMTLYVQSTKTNAGTRKLPMTQEVYECFQAIIEDREKPKKEKMVGGRTGFLYLDKNGLPEVAMHWEHRFRNMVKRYNEIYKVQMPKITPHICRHTYCSNMARARMNPKTLQYLMGHSEIGVTMNTYTHLGYDDAKDEMIRLKELEEARREVEKTTEKPKPANQNMFRAV